MKLPLSTTYVTFMVAMGTSLADRAWGRESAVYRVAGVVNVIGGWFMTALFAFLFAGTLVYIIHLGRGAAIAVLLILTSALIIRNFLKHRRETAASSAGQEGLTKAASKTVQGIIEESSDNVAKSIYRASRIFNGVVEGLSNQDAPELKKMVKRVAKLEDEVDDLRNHLFYFIKSLDDASVRGSNFYIMVLANLTDIVQSLKLLAKKSFKHVDNHHKPLSKSQISDLAEVEGNLAKILVDVETAFKTQNFTNLSECLQRKSSIITLVSAKVDAQIERTRDEENSPKNTTLYFNLLLESKDLARGVFSLIEEYHNGIKGQ